MLQTSNLAVLLIFPALSISAIHEVLGIKFKGGRSQSCTVVKSKTFWRTAVQLNLAYNWLTITKASTIRFFSSLPYCLLSFNVQSPAKMFYF